MTVYPCCEHCLTFGRVQPDGTPDTDHDQHRSPCYTRGCPGRGREPGEDLNLSDDERAGLLSALDDLHGPAATGEPVTVLWGKDRWGNAIGYSTGANGPAPAATDEPALAVIRNAVHRWWLDDPEEPCDDDCDGDTQAVGISGAIVAALEANGYVVLPRKELDEAQEAIFDYLNGGSARAKRRMSAARAALIAARRAVVEAVGPTREDTNNG